MAWVNLTELSEQTGIPKRTLQHIRDHERDVLVMRGDGKTTEYEQPACAIRLRDRAVAMEVRRIEEKYGSMATDPKRQRDQVALERDRIALARDRAELVPTQDVEREWSQLLGALRTRLDNMPGEFAPEILHLVDIPSAVTALRKVTRALISELRGVKLPDEDAAG